ncbi:hypothetical protein EDC94DRAFT_588310 [Helicostylum pulchrum]|nr:hypothetical protein EDC94DRAFT_588310 [Helicostylum pulchrum]
MDLDLAYIKARKFETRYLNDEKKKLFKIYAHIIDVYRHHSNWLMFDDAKAAELDALMKVWEPIFEILFPDNNVTKCKWGESCASNNQFKVDCRLIFKYQNDYKSRISKIPHSKKDER